MYKDGSALKRIVYFALWKIGVDYLLRYVHKNNILILAYHGITRQKFQLSPWTQVHCIEFEQQIRYLRKRYHFIALKDAVESLISGKKLHDRSAVITFDDGYRNNLTTALPILKKYNVPATIFVTAGYIGTQQILPSDEVYTILLGSREIDSFILEEYSLGPFLLDTPSHLLESCVKLDKELKEFPTTIQKEILGNIKKTIGYNHDKNSNLIEESRLLSWDEMNELLKTDLIQIGAHTVSHEILTNIDYKNAKEEIINSKYIIEEKLNCDINLFAYPNGSPLDFDTTHMNILKDSGFICGLTTIHKLNHPSSNPYRLGRVCVGPNSCENLSHFALRTSGFFMRGSLKLRGEKKISVS